MTQEEKTIKKSYVFSEINYDILYEITGFQLVRDRSIFKEWFDFEFDIDKYDEDFLIKLIKANEYNINDYLEKQLLGHFISPLLNRVYFYSDSFREWFQPEISGTINGYKISGRLDFMVASGIRRPETPYFFIQEFKRSIPRSKSPLEQLLAQMAVAMENNKTKQMRGAYNIGKLWAFVIIKKLKDDKYEYYESESFNCIKIKELKKIYVYLQAVKHKYCK